MESWRHARHGADGVVDVLAGDDEERVDEVVERERRLAQHVAGWPGCGADVSCGSSGSTCGRVLSWGTRRAVAPAIFAPGRAVDKRAGVAGGGAAVPREARREALRAAAAPSSSPAPGRRGRRRPPTRGRAGGRAAPATLPSMPRIFCTCFTPSRRRPWTRRWRRQAARRRGPARTSGRPRGAQAVLVVGVGEQHPGGALAGEAFPGLLRGRGGGGEDEDVLRRLRRPPRPLPDRHAGRRRRGSRPPSRRSAPRAAA